MMKTMIFSFLLLLISSAHGASVPPAVSVVDGDPAALATDPAAPARGGGGAAARGVGVVAPPVAPGREESLAQMLRCHIAGLEADIEHERTTHTAEMQRARTTRDAVVRERDDAVRRTAQEQAARVAAEDARDAANARATASSRERDVLQSRNFARDVLIIQRGKLGEIFGEMVPERLTLDNIQAIGNQYGALRGVAGLEAFNFDRIQRAFEAFQNPLLLRTYQRNPLADDNRFLGIADCLALPLPADARQLDQRVDLGDAAVVDRCADALAIVVNNPHLLPNLDQSGKTALLQLLDYINNNPAARAQFEAVRNHRAGLDQLFHEARYGKSYSKQLLLAGVVLLVAGYATHRYYRHQIELFNNDIYSIRAAVKDENTVRALIAERRKWIYFLPGGAQRFNNNVMKKLLPIESVAPAS